MKIRDIQRDIEESIAMLPALTLPPGLEGLRHLPVSDRDPQVSIRYVGNSRKVREDASAGYFDPDRCEVVIGFAEFDAPQGEEELGATQDEEDLRESGAPDQDGPAEEPDFEMAIDQLIDALRKAEGMRPFVGLKWFRDHVLPECGHRWARDPRTSGSLLRRATQQRLVLTSQVPNPNQPLHPVTAIRINRRHPRFQSDAPGRSAGFKPMRIRGGSISDTVLSERR